MKRPDIKNSSTQELRDWLIYNYCVNQSNNKHDTIYEILVLEELIDRFLSSEF